MKIVSIGDCHGEDFWKDIVDDNIDSANRIIFLGDYTDSYNVSDFDMQNNLVDIIELKEKYPDKIVLLLGNHDLQYMFSYASHGCSGFRHKMYESLHDLFNHYKNLFLPSYQIDNYLWSHAGLSKGWFIYRFVKSFDYDKWFDAGFSLSEIIEMQFNKMNYTIFDVGYERGGNCKHGGGPFWADRNETYKKPITGYHQRCGHTPIDKIKTYTISENTSITYCDTRAKNKGAFDTLII